MKTIFYAALVLILTVHPVCAMKCVEPSLERKLETAVTVFEGRVLRIERRFDGDRRENKDGYHYQRATIHIDRVITGDVQAGQDVPVIMNLWGDISDDAPDWVESEKDSKKGFFVFSAPYEKSVSLMPDANTVFSHGKCDRLVWDATPENIKLVEDWAENR